MKKSLRNFDAGSRTRVSNPLTSNPYAMTSKPKPTQPPNSDSTNQPQPPTNQAVTTPITTAPSTLQTKPKVSPFQNQAPRLLLAHTHQYPTNSQVNNESNISETTQYQENLDNIHSNESEQHQLREVKLPASFLRSNSSINQEINQNETTEIVSQHDTSLNPSLSTTSTNQKPSELIDNLQSSSTQTPSTTNMSFNENQSQQQQQQQQQQQPQTPLYSNMINNQTAMPTFIPGASQQLQQSSSTQFFQQLKQGIIPDSNQLHYHQHHQQYYQQQHNHSPFQQQQQQPHSDQNQHQSTLPTSSEFTSKFLGPSNSKLDPNLISASTSHYDNLFTQFNSIDLFSSSTSSNNHLSTHDINHTLPQSSRPSSTHITQQQSQKSPFIRSQLTPKLSPLLHPFNTKPIPNQNNLQSQSPPFIALDSKQSNTNPPSTKKNYTLTTALFPTYTPPTDTIIHPLQPISHFDLNSTDKFQHDMNPIHTDLNPTSSVNTSINVPSTTETDTLQIQILPNHIHCFNIPFSLFLPPQSSNMDQNNTTQQTTQQSGSYPATQQQQHLNKTTIITFLNQIISHLLQDGPTGWQQYSTDLYSSLSNSIDAIHKNPFRQDVRDSTQNSPTLSSSSAKTVYSSATTGIDHIGEFLHHYSEKSHPNRFIHFLIKNDEISFLIDQSTMTRLVSYTEMLKNHYSLLKSTTSRRFTFISPTSSLPNSKSLDESTQHQLISTLHQYLHNIYTNSQLPLSTDVTNQQQQSTAPLSHAALWTPFRISQGALMSNFEVESGLVSAISNSLAQNNLPIFSLSTNDHEYCLIPSDLVELSLRTLLDHFPNCSIVDFRSPNDILPQHTTNTYHSINVLKPSQLPQEPTSVLSNPSSSTTTSSNSTSTSFNLKLLSHSIFLVPFTLTEIVINMMTRILPCITQLISTSFEQYYYSHYTQTNPTSTSSTSNSDIFFTYTEISEEVSILCDVNVLHQMSFTIDEESHLIRHTPIMQHCMSMIIPLLNQFQQVSTSNNTNTAHNNDSVEHTISNPIFGKLLHELNHNLHYPLWNSNHSHEFPQHHTVDLNHAVSRCRDIYSLHVFSTLSPNLINLFISSVCQMYSECNNNNQASLTTIADQNELFLSILQNQLFNLTPTFSSQSTINTSLHPTSQLQSLNIPSHLSTLIPIIQTALSDWKSSNNNYIQLHQPESEIHQHQSPTVVEFLDFFAQFLTPHLKQFLTVLDDLYLHVWLYYYNMTQNQSEISQHDNIIQDASKFDLISINSQPTPPSTWLGRSWRVFELDGIWDTTCVGIVGKLSKSVTDHKILPLYLSSFRTDYLSVPHYGIFIALRALLQDQHTISPCFKP